MANSDLTPDPVELDINALENNYLPQPPSVLICTACGGVLWEIREGNLLRFQCHVGHTLSVEDLLESQAEEIEQRLWSLLRVLKERMKITRQMAKEVREHDCSLTAVQHLEAQAQQALQRAELIRQVLLIGEVSPKSETSAMNEASNENEDS